MRGAQTEGRRGLGIIDTSHTHNLWGQDTLPLRASQIQKRRGQLFFKGLLGVLKITVSLCPHKVKMLCY